MTDLQKSFTNAALGLASLGMVTILWKQPNLLTMILIFISILMFVVRTEKRSGVVYAIGFIFGPVAEMLAINTGAWEYAAPSFAGIPLWLPFLWANAALFIVNTEKLSHILFKKN
jgi:hypothetical protein